MTNHPSPSMWLTRARGVAGAYYRLAVADLALARAAGVQAAAAGAFALVFGTTAFAALAAAAVAALVAAGIALHWALLLLGIAAATLAALCVLRVHSMLDIANFETSRRQFDRFFADEE